MEENQRYGWDDITEAFDKLYPGQENPKHYGTLIKWRLGGKDPLDGISIYEEKDYYHFVTYGLSEIYEKESENKEISGYGMEFTLKLKKDSLEDVEAELKGICSILQSLARMTYEHGELFLPMEYIYTGQTLGLDVKQKSELTGFITISEPKLTQINTVNGKLQFVELIGVTNKELKAIIDKNITVGELYQKLGTDVTDYKRKSII